MIDSNAVPSVDKDNYQLVWRSPPGNWFDNRWTTAPESCPFLIPAVCAGQQRLHHSMLIAGVRYAWTDVARSVRCDYRPASDLGWVRWLFNQATRRGHRLSAATVVLALARNARAQYGLLVSARVLYGGTEMYRDIEALPPLPGPDDQATAVYLALVEAVWRLLTLAPHVDVNSACEAIVKAYESVPRQALGPVASEATDFAYCVALHVLVRRDRLRAFFWQEAGRLQAGGLRERVLSLVDDETLSLADILDALPPVTVTPLVH